MRIKFVEVQNFRKLKSVRIDEFRDTIPKPTERCAIR